MRLIKWNRSGEMFSPIRRNTRKQWCTSSFGKNCLFQVQEYRSRQQKKLSSSSLPSSFVVYPASCTRRRHCLSKTLVYYCFCVSSQWSVHFPRSVLSFVFIAFGLRSLWDFEVTFFVCLVIVVFIVVVVFCVVVLLLLLLFLLFVSLFLLLLLSVFVFKLQNVYTYIVVRRKPRESEADIAKRV